MQIQQFGRLAGVKHLPDAVIPFGVTTPFAALQ